MEIAPYDEIDGFCFKGNLVLATIQCSNNVSLTSLKGNIVWSLKVASVFIASTYTGQKPSVYQVDVPLLRV